MIVGILAREGAILAILFLLGLGPAAYLPRRWGTAMRLALAPSLGLAAGSALLTTASFFAPLRHSLWFVVLPAATVSTALAIRRLHQHGGCRRSVDARSLAALVLIALWTVGLFSLPMLARGSYGPMGFGIFDAPGYGTLIFGYARNTTRHPIGISPPAFENQEYDDEAWGEPWDLTSRYAWGFVFQHTGATTIPAALTIPARWPAWTLVSPYMAVLVTTAALAVFGSALFFFEGRLWAASLSSLLTAGPVLMQVHVDGSLGLLAGLALVPAVLVFLLWTVGGGGWRAAFYLGLVLAGLQAVYPELLPIVGATIAFAWLVNGALGTPAATRAHVAVRLGGAVALSAVLSPRTLPWTVDYLVRLGTRRLFGLDGFVHYNMRPRYLLGWLFQTRDFYSFAFANPEGASELVWGIGLPLVGLIIVFAGVLWRPRLLVIAGVPLAASLQAVVSQRAGCPYCVQRSLLIIAVALPVLLVGGLIGLTMRRRGCFAAAVFTAALLISAASIQITTERRAADGAYMAAPEIAAMVAEAERLPADALPLHLEGFDTIPVWSWADVPTTYMAMRELGRRLSIVAAYNEFGGFSYPRRRPVGHPAFAPDYGWVLTRFGGLDNGRRTVTRRGPLALQKRAGPFDVTLARGVASDIGDPRGVPWVSPPGEHFGLEQGPLTAWVTGPPTGTAWIEVRLRAPAGTTIAGPAGTDTRVGPDGVVSGCLPVTEQGPLRILTFGVTPDPPDFNAPANGRPPVYRPAHSVQLLALRALDQPCPG